jgi:metallo-beta-lactamase family protein
MDTITFLGAAGTVTGSSFILTGSNGTKILVDMGMFQGDDDANYTQNFTVGFNPTELIAVVLTHAHIDHCGRLPLLISSGYSGPVYMTDATAEIIEIALYDSARIAKENNYQKPLYTSKEVDGLLRLVQIVRYDQPFEIGEFSLTYKDAGHILGSAIIEINEKMPSTDAVRKIIFSGDLGNYPQSIVKQTEFIKGADAVVMESTYGDTDHPDEDTIGIIQNEINTIEKTDGTLLIPAFSIDRTQTLLHIFNTLKNEKKIDYRTPIYLDSPMAIRVTQVYKAYRTLFNRELYEASKKDDPFDFSGLEIVEDAKRSDHIKLHKGPKVIMAGNGMASGGRIVGHLAHFLPYDKSRVLIVGYQAEGTYGRQLLEGSKLLEIENKTVRVRATITEVKGLSAHADQQRLLKWVGEIKGLKHIFLVHGEDTAREALAVKIKQTSETADITLPQVNQVFSLK